MNNRESTTRRVPGAPDLGAQHHRVIAATKLDSYIRNHFRGNTEMLAAWTSARHIERAPKRKKDPTPTPPPAPLAAPAASGSGMGTGGITSTPVTAG